jgi:hypothetical protein
LSSTAGAGRFQSAILGDAKLVRNLNKYRNQPVMIGDRWYQSKHEADCGEKLIALERAGEISNLRLQWPINILPSNRKLGYPRPLTYIADFYFHENGRQVVADAKGLRTPVYRLKKRLLAQLCNIQIEEM